MVSEVAAGCQAGAKPAYSTAFPLPGAGRGQEGQTHMHLSTQDRFGEGPQQKAQVQEVLQDSRAQTGREGERSDRESHATR